MLDFDFHIHSIYSDGDSTLKEIIEEAILKNMSHIAFTDHMDDFGNFMFNSNKNRNIEDYLSSIKKLKHEYNSEINIFAGAEISTDIKESKGNFNGEDQIIENLDDFSIFLIEGTYINDPIESAINLKEFLDDRDSDIPIIIAHPEYRSISHQELVKLIDLKIGFELNENKFSDSNKYNFHNHLKYLDNDYLERIKITLGSDAHELSAVGEIETIRNFVVEHELEDNVIIPE